MTDEPEQVAGQIVDCPIVVDRAGRPGWLGDPANRFVSCGFAVTVLPGTWEMYPDGPATSFAETAEVAMRAHIGLHALADFIASKPRS